MALRSRQRVTGEWTEMSYRQVRQCSLCSISLTVLQLAAEVQTTARAFIETGLHRHHAVVTIRFSTALHS